MSSRSTWQQGKSANKLKSDILDTYHSLADLDLGTVLAKISVMGVRKSEWSGSDDRQDNITWSERGAILRPCLGCELKCGTVERLDGEDNVRVYGDPATIKPNRQPLGTGAVTGLRTRTVPNHHRLMPPVAFLTAISKKA